MTNLVELKIPEPDQALMGAADNFRVDGVTITSQPEYEAAADALRAVKSAAKDIESKRKELVAPLNDAKNKIQAFFKAPLDRLARAEAALKRGMVAYTQEQERIRREQQRIAEEQARKERERLARRA